MFGITLPDSVVMNAQKKFFGAVASVAAPIPYLLSTLFSDVANQPVTTLDGQTLSEDNDGMVSGVLKVTKAPTASSIEFVSGEFVAHEKTTPDTVVANSSTIQTTVSHAWTKGFVIFVTQESYQEVSATNPMYFYIRPNLTDPEWEAGKIFRDSDNIGARTKAYVLDTDKVFVYEYVVDTWVLNTIESVTPATFYTALLQTEMALKVSKFSLDEDNLQPELVTPIIDDEFTGAEALLHNSLPDTINNGNTWQSDTGVYSRMKRNGTTSAISEDTGNAFAAIDTGESSWINLQTVKTNGVNNSTELLVAVFGDLASTDNDLAGSLYWRYAGGSIGYGIFQDGVQVAGNLGSGDLAVNTEYTFQTIKDGNKFQVYRDGVLKREYLSVSASHQAGSISGFQTTGTDSSSLVQRSRFFKKGGYTINV